MSVGKESQAGMVAQQQHSFQLSAREMTATHSHLVFTPQAGLMSKVRGSAFLLFKFGFSFNKRSLPKLGQTKEVEKRTTLQSRLWFSILLTHSDSCSLKHHISLSFALENDCLQQSYSHLNNLDFAHSTSLFQCQEGRQWQWQQKSNALFLKIGGFHVLWKGVKARRDCELPGV